MPDKDNNKNKINYFDCKWISLTNLPKEEVPAAMDKHTECIHMYAYHPDTKEFLGKVSFLVLNKKYIILATSNEGVLPFEKMECVTEVKPESLFKDYENYSYVFDNESNTWKLVEDNRPFKYTLKGKKEKQYPNQYKFWLPSEHDDNESKFRFTDELGPLPDGATKHFIPRYELIHRLSESNNLKHDEIFIKLLSMLFLDDDIEKGSEDYTLYVEILNKALSDFSYMNILPITILQFPKDELEIKSTTFMEKVDNTINKYRIVHSHINKIIRDKNTKYETLYEMERKDDINYINQEGIGYYDLIFEQVKKDYKIEVLENSFYLDREEIEREEEYEGEGFEGDIDE